MTIFNIKTIIAGALAVLALQAAPASAKDMTLSHGDHVTERSILKAGDFVWNDFNMVPGKIKVTINLKTQMAYVYRGNFLIGATNISTGREGFDTPTGTFTILGKEDNHWSKKYKADMPWTMWVNNDGVALHGGVTPGRRTSHGCIHLPHDFAEQLYTVMQTGATVKIINESPARNLSIASITN